MGKDTTRLLVYRPRILWLTIAGLALALALAGLLIWTLARGHHADELDRLHTSNERLASQVAALERQVSDVTRQAAILRRGDQIDAAACEELEKDFGRAQRKVRDLESELELYRGIVAPASAASGVQIQGLELDHGPGIKGIRFNILMIQLGRYHDLVTGGVDLRIRGQRDGKPQSVEFSTARPPAEGRLEYRFRYFQNIEGRFELPDGFQPESVVVIARGAGKKAKTIERSFSWPL